MAGRRGCVWPCSSTAANGSCRCSPIMSGRGSRLVLQPGEKLALSQRTNGMFELRVETVQA